MGIPQLSKPPGSDRIDWPSNVFGVKIVHFVYFDFTLLKALSLS